MSSIDDLLIAAGRVDQLPQNAIERGSMRLRHAVIAAQAQGAAHPATTRRATRGRVFTRWIAVPAAAAVITGALIALPGGAGLQSSSAGVFATWQGTPEPLTGARLDAAAAACRASDGVGEVALQGAPVQAAERRGPWALLALEPTGGGSADASVAMCLTHEDTPGVPDVAYLGTARAIPGENAAELAGRGDLGTIGTIAQDTMWGPAVPTGPVRLTHAWAAAFDGAGAFTMIDGTAGPDVAAVVVHKGDRSIEATVTGGRFIAWWPERSLPIVYAPESPQSGDPHCTGDGCVTQGWDQPVTATVTLTDGSVVDAVPLGPTAPGGRPFADVVG